MEALLQIIGTWALVIFVIIALGLWQNQRVSRPPEIEDHFL